MIWVDKQKESLKTQFISQLSQFLWHLMASYSHVDSVAVHSNCFFVIWVTLRRKSPAYCSCCNAKLYFFEVFQSEAFQNNFHDYLIKHVKETIFMKILKQVRTNVNYTAYVSDCITDICNTHTITFGYKRYFLSHFNLKLHLASECFSLFTLSIRTRVMMVDIGTGVAPVNIAFPSSRNAALIERKKLHFTILSIKLHHCTLSEIKTRVLTLSDVLACVSIHCADQKQHSNQDFLTKCSDNTLQICGDTANEYPQAYNTGVGVKSHGVCSLHQCKCAGYTMFLKTTLLFNSFFSKIKSIFFHSIRSEQYPQAQQGVTDSSCGFSFYG